VSAAAYRDAWFIWPAEAIHQKLAGPVLATVYYAGWHHLVEAEDWPRKLPADLHGAVPPARPASTMRSLQNDVPANCANGPSRSAGCDLLSCVRRAAAVSSS
jgi:hypothetical protein